MLRSQISSCEGCPASAAQVFEDPLTVNQLSEWHSRFESAASRLLVVLHGCIPALHPTCRRAAEPSPFCCRLAGGCVIGDRAIGAVGGEEVDPRVAAAVAETLELMRQPTQRLMRYQTFLGGGTPPDF